MEPVPLRTGGTAGKRWTLSVKPFPGGAGNDAGAIMMHECWNRMAAGTARFLTVRVGSYRQATREASVIRTVTDRSFETSVRTHM